MNFEIKLSVIRRKGMANRKVIAPFINGCNVWDIPEKHWTEDVQKAIEHAYLMGRRDSVNHIKKEISLPYSNPTGAWGEIKDAS